MPHTSSAKKHLRKSLKQKLRNRTVKKGIKVQVKKVLAAVEEGTLDATKQEYNLAAKKLDKAAAKRVIHPNTAARRKSRLARMMNAKKAAGN